MLPEKVIPGVKPVEYFYTGFSRAKYMKSVLVFIVSSFLFSSASYGQDSILSFEQAIIIALENNFDIRISGNELSKLKNLNYAGQAGMLPELNLNGAYTHSENSTKQKYSNGDVVDRKNAVSENLNTELALGWTLFDGLRMFSTKRRLAEIASRGEITFRMQMEEVYLQVVRSYFEISRQQQLLRSIEEEIILAQERLKIAERRFTNGSGSKLDVLHTKTDLNARLSAEFSQTTVLQSAIIELNRLMARPSDMGLQAEDSIRITYSPSLEDLKKKSGELNSLRSYYRKQLLISEISVKESGSYRWPEIKLKGSYLYTNTENDAGFILQNRNQGFNYGITATLPLFNGFRISRALKNSRLDVLNARLELEKNEEAVNAEILIAFRNFRDQLELLKLEEENILSSREILLISQERFKSGASSVIELKDVQRSHEEAMNRLVNARFQAKMAESNLKHLAGELIKE